jgi:hypothetical protein
MGNGAHLIMPMPLARGTPITCTNRESCQRGFALASTAFISRGKAISSQRRPVEPAALLQRFTHVSLPGGTAQGDPLDVPL